MTLKEFYAEASKTTEAFIRVNVELTRYQFEAASHGKEVFELRIYDGETKTTTSASNFEDLLLAWKIKRVEKLSPPSVAEAMKELDI